MKYLILLAVLPWVAAQHTGCSHGVASSAQIAIASDRFRYSDHLHELGHLQNLIENFRKQNYNVHLFLTHYSFVTKKPHVDHVNYTLKNQGIPEFTKTSVWDFFRGTPRSGKKPAQIYIILSSFTSYGFHAPVWELRRQGIEIFTVQYDKIKDVEREKVASFPPDTHVYSWRHHDHPETLVSELTRAVCMSIERNERKAKKALLPQVRLVNGTGPCDGRVGVLYNGTWGWLSDEDWTRRSADVVCRQLRCGPSVEALKGDAFGSGGGHILQAVACTGYEKDISQCLLGVWAEEAPGSHGRAGVVCLPSGVGDVSLVNGSGPCDGIVEVSLNNHPSRVCSWNFDLLEAAIICRQLGCGSLQHVQMYRAEPDANIITVEKLICSGSESKLSECGASLWRPETCYLNIHAGITCSPSDLTGVRLVGGSSTCSGRVKVQINGTSGPLCADDWTLAEDVVVCREAGCGPAIKMKQKWITRPPKARANLQRLFCAGNEPNLSRCAAVASKGYDCDFLEAEVLCSQSGISNVTLVQGNSPCEGRVEVYHKGQWGTICDEEWDLGDANVVCRQVGCGSALVAPKGAVFGQGSGPVWLEKVFCNGSESLLSHCGALISRVGGCDHAQDSSVICAERIKP
ncbi:scavenger receptor cysteine-rich domain-containing group B protein-like [Spea bombifrons]|uniref:scavenger receptor cysteine-rich domain-containing group B protein-like n=1 Tax=Spea bombifrons TaxID=233779 RepID=UPI00234BA324|nr:scavenger receptor cysteine-rich domain-containing group B protein-like [Spea bombifrons]